ncbi:MAG: methionyl-tRNA formyltransferase [Elusimicrobia bacterium]|nr:methionyl-tRNA formyltransferase [Elusimicrobiota bacterium]MDE2313342.1 methionyl-tRNA formyltransferase [Elusimicrobiota bacterium]
MKIVFFGTPAPAVPFLELLASEKGRVAAVVTQPDRPAGRGLEARPSPVKARALGLGIAVLNPERPSLIAADLKALGADLAVVVAYGRILKEDVLGAFRLGCLNVHFSLLPRLRGAAPVQWALARGEAKTGVTLFWLDEGMDTGPIFSQIETPIGPEENAAELLERLTNLGLGSVREALADLERGGARREPQKGEASLAPLLRKEDGRFSFDETARAVHGKVRGFCLWPRAFVVLRLPKGETKLSVLSAGLEENSPKAGPPGAIARVGRDGGVLIQCRDACLWLRTVCPEGKKPLAAAEFLNGLRLKAGDALPFQA